MFIILPFYFFKFRGSRVIITVIPKGRNCDPQKRERRERERQTGADRTKLERLLESIGYWIRVFHVQNSS